MSRKALLVCLSFLLLSLGLSSQEATSPSNADLLARLSYNSSGAVARSSVSRFLTMEAIEF